MSDWHQARLIPVSGIGTSDEQEGRATSALLAVMHVVPDFGRSIVGPLGAPAGRLQTFTETIFPLGERKVRPDGLLQASRGGRSWTALVEVKTGSNELEVSQVENYLDVAREQGFDAVLTISNQMALPGQHPVSADKRKLGKGAKTVALHHLAWAEVLAAAVTHQVHRGVADPEQAYILSELIRYLEHPRSGALQFNDMGQNWVGVRDDVCARTARPATKPVLDVVARFEQLSRYAALRLEQRLGTPVTILTPRSLADASARQAQSATTLTGDGRLVLTLRIPGAMSTITATADLRSGTLTLLATVPAPAEGRPLTRIRWLLRQLTSAPATVRVQALTSYTRAESAALRLDQARETPEALLPDTSHEVKRFDLWLDLPLGTKRAAGRGGFITSVLEGIDMFYDQVLQPMRPWTPSAPRAKTVPTAAASVAEDEHGEAPDLPEESAPISDVADTDPLGHDDYAPGPQEPAEPAPAPIAQGSTPLRIDSRLQIQITGEDTTTGAVEFDTIALLLGEDGLVSNDHDLVFYGQAVHPSGAAALAEVPGAPNALVLDVQGLPEPTQRVRIGVQAIQHAAATGVCTVEVLDLLAEQTLVRASLPPAGSVGSTTLVELLSLIRQEDEWTLEVAVEALATDLEGFAKAAGIQIE
jgi:stress response protein SCP2